MALCDSVMIVKKNEILKYGLLASFLIMIISLRHLNAYGNDELVPLGVIAGAIFTILIFYQACLKNVNNKHEKIINGRIYSGDAIVTMSKGNVDAGLVEKAIAEGKKAQRNKNIRYLFGDVETSTVIAVVVRNSDGKVLDIELM